MGKTHSSSKKVYFCRFFETLHGKYWDSALRSDCDADAGYRGVSLDSLGGVFVVAGAGFLLAFASLAVQAWLAQRTG